MVCIRALPAFREEFTRSSGLKLLFRAATPNIPRETEAGFFFFMVRGCYPNGGQEIKRLEPHLGAADVFVKVFSVIKPRSRAGLAGDVGNASLLSQVPQLPRGYAKILSRRFNLE
jgi:hypothetical protein